MKKEDKIIGYLDRASILLNQIGDKEYQDQVNNILNRFLLKCLDKK